jgi:hypothetical protein
MRVVCWSCATDGGERERIGRRDACATCGVDLHSCRGCRFYDARAYNGCLESQAARVVDKERSNFCDWFAAPERAATRVARSGAAGGPPSGGARAELERLFKRR